MTFTAGFDDTPSSTPPLAGVRVIELSDGSNSESATRLCGTTLAQLGADVIRIARAEEHRNLPDQGKRVFSADFHEPGAQRLLRDLITDAGALVTTAAGGDLLDYDALAAIRPDLIFVQVRGDVEPGSPADQTSCGLFAALSVVAAAHRREVTGAGAKIELSVADFGRSGAPFVPEDPFFQPLSHVPPNSDHTAAVLAEYHGLTPEEIDQLAAAGTIRVPTCSAHVNQKDRA
ncbi:MAG: CoA transferase [Rhodococcus sp. (in: high G+C Gram-positive bacteria)]|uniref:CoA transferase n=1 Tax=Rhodococcus sp. TaxID=1831 RepID=UPI003BB11D3F